MCLGIPGKVVSFLDEGSSLAKIDVNGVRRNVNVDLVHSESDPLQIGDWVLIHVGFAMTKIDEEEALQTLALLQEMDDLYEQEIQELKNSRIE